jgi:hypothetical protein
VEAIAKKGRRMPYIGKNSRDRLKEDCPVTSGELNYVITKIINEHVGGRRSYSVYNEIIGVLECVKQEFYRRVVSLYEDKKKEDNGDVYNC